MDLRTKKTLRALRDAFMDLRRDRPLERVTVRELCERAEVSKATFYLHYHSIYELSTELQADTVRRVLDDLADPDALLSDTRRFTQELFASCIAHADEINVLFSRGQEHALIEHMERALREHISATKPELMDDLRFCALLTYQVHGCHAAYMRYASGSSEKDRQLVVDAIADASDAVAKLR